MIASSDSREGATETNSIIRLTNGGESPPANNPSRRGDPRSSAAAIAERADTGGVRSGRLDGKGVATSFNSTQIQPPGQLPRNPIQILWPMPILPFMHVRLFLTNCAPSQPALLFTD